MSIKFENTEVVGWEATIRGMRNPMNSWEKGDSWWSSDCDYSVEHGYIPVTDYEKDGRFYIGPNDHDLMMRLRNAGTDHRKFMRMIVVYVDITAPLYWWKEFDTYKIGTVANSCSTMHKIADKEFTLDDFSCEHLTEASIMTLKLLIKQLNQYRLDYLNGSTSFNAEDRKWSKQDWWQMIQLLPSSYNQRRTVMMNYEVLANVYKSRKNHKLDEWAEHSCITSNHDDWGDTVNFGFCDWIETLPLSELITGGAKDE